MLTSRPSSDAIVALSQQKTVSRVDRSRRVTARKRFVLVNSIDFASGAKRRNWNISREKSQEEKVNFWQCRHDTTTLVVVSDRKVNTKTSEEKCNHRSDEQRCEVFRGREVGGNLR